KTDFQARKIEITHLQLPCLQSVLEYVRVPAQWAHAYWSPAQGDFVRPQALVQCVHIVQTAARTEYISPPVIVTTKILQSPLIKCNFQVLSTAADVQQQDEEITYTFKIQKDW